MPSEPPPSSSPATRLPRKFGSYLLFDRIGAGGMAEIFLARAKTELGGQRLVVVKQILPSLAAHPQFAEMLIHEAKLAARLDHANVAQVYDLGRSDESLFIAMEYVEGFDLNDLLRRCTKEKVPVPIELALCILCDTLRGLDYAHRRTAEDGTPLGIVHRDVSPSNVLVSFDGQVKLCDFGIAHANDLVGEATSQTAEALKGKAGYMSPEHARGEAVDARADVFAVGILLWELLAGKRMYRLVDGGPPLLELAQRADVKPPPERGLENEAALHAIVMKALAPNRDARYPSAQAMLRDIEQYLADARVVVSPIRLGDWLVASLGSEIVLQRRRRQRAAEALALGPPVTLTPMPFQPLGAITDPTPTPVMVRKRVEPVTPAANVGPTESATPTVTSDQTLPAPTLARGLRSRALVFGALGVLVLLLGCFYALRGP